MKYFEVDGLWSIGDEKQRMAGTLSFSKKGLRLKLIGGFRKGWSPTAFLGDYSVIKGVVEQNDYGSFVTLYDCFTTNTSINHAGAGSETIRVSRAILGDDYPPEEPHRYELLSVRFTHLDEWVGWRNMEVEWRQSGSLGVDIHYTRPEDIIFEVDQVTLKISASFSTSSPIGEASVSERPHLLISGMEPTPAKKATDEFQYRLQNLLTFATDAPNSVDENLIYGERSTFGDVKLPKKYHLFHNFLYHEETQGDRLQTRDMLFDFQDVKRAGVNVFQNWFDFVKKHETFWLIYFAHVYKQPNYVDDRFRTIVMNLSLYCRSAFGASERSLRALASLTQSVLALYDENERNWIDVLIPDGSQLDLPFHLMELLRDNNIVMKKIINTDFQSFVSSVCLTLGHIDRRTSSNVGGVFEGNDLHYATEKLRWLMKFAMLKELGFSDELINMLADRNKRFNDLKSI